MFCPNCGNEISLFADKCLCCGENFKSLTLAQRHDLERNSRYSNPKRNSKQRKANASKKRSVSPKNNRVTEVRIEYNNGIACKEGMSRKGTKLKKGSFKKRANNEGIGFRLYSYSLGQY